MSSALVQLQDTVRQFKASYELELASARRAIDWDKFWATAHRQATQAQRTVEPLHLGSPHKSPSPRRFQPPPQEPQSHSSHTAREAQETWRDEQEAEEDDVYYTPSRQLLAQRAQRLAGTTSPLREQQQVQAAQSPPTPASHIQSPPALLSQRKSPQVQETSPRTEPKRVQFAPPDHSQEEAPLEVEEIPLEDIVYIDIELDDGTVATVGIAPEEDPETVAIEFVQEHRLADHYVPLLAKYLQQTLAESSNIAVFDDPPEHVSPPLTMSLESISLSWNQRPSLASVKNRYLIIVRLQNNQNFDWNEIVGAQQTDMLVYQDSYTTSGGIGAGRAHANRNVLQFELLTPTTSLVLPHGRKPMVNLELWQLTRRDMVTFAATRADPIGMLDLLHTSGNLLATALFMTNNDEFDGNGSATLQDSAGRTLGALSFVVRRTTLGSR